MKSGRTDRLTPIIWHRRPNQSWEAVDLFWNAGFYLARPRERDELGAERKEVPWRLSQNAMRSARFLQAGYFAKGKTHAPGRTPQHYLVFE